MKKFQLGFTFIELLLVVTIIVIFSGITLSYFNSFNLKKDLENEGRRLFDTLELAKTKASSADLDSTCTNFYGYKFIISSTTSYTLSSYGDTAGCNNSFSNLYTIKTPNILITQPSLTNYYLFKPLSLGVTKNPVVMSDDIILKSTAGGAGQCIKVTVNPSGMIELGTIYSC